MTALAWVLGALGLTLGAVAVGWGWRQRDAVAASEARIAELLEAREQLLLAVAHELRTPLMRLRFATELLVDEDREAERARQAERVQRDIDELDALVEDLLSWGRLEAEAVRRSEPIDVPAELERQLDRARRSRSGIEADLGPIEVEGIEGDRRLIRRGLSNLVSNAVRYGEGRVRLSAVSDGALVRLRCEDDGPGIPAADHARVVEPFVRLDPSRSAEFGGSGLGLALVRRIAEAHGGRLVLGRSDLGGLRADITVPLTAVTLADGS